MEKELFAANEKEKEYHRDKMVTGSEGVRVGVMMGPLERNILGKFDSQHVAKEMSPFSHNCFVIEENIIIGFDFSELKKETPGSEVFRVRNTSNYSFLVQMLI